MTDSHAARLLLARLWVASEERDREGRRTTSARSAEEVNNDAAEAARRK